MGESIIHFCYDIKTSKNKSQLDINLGLQMDSKNLKYSQNSTIYWMCDLDQVS